MKEKTATANPKNKALSAVLISLSVVFFIASGVLIFISLNKNKEIKPVVNGAEIVETQKNPGGVTEFVESENINPTLNSALISVVLDKYNVRSKESLMQQTCVVNSADAKSLLESYTAYLDSLAIEGIKYNLLYGDYDGDGTDEYYLYVYFPVKATFSALGDDDAYSNYINNAGGQNDSQGIVIYGDTYSGQTTFRTYYSGLNYFNEHRITVVNGVMSVSHEASVDEIYVVCTPYVVYDSYEYQEDAFIQMCESYAESIIAKGYSNVYYYCADLSDASGEEVAFVYSDAEGIPYTVIVTFINGKIHTVYKNFSEVCATYIAEINSIKYLIEYTQVMGLGNDDYESNYFYRVFRFDEGYASVDYKSNSTTVKYGSVTAENEDFFEKFNAYIVNAIVLSDPYELTGYGSLSQSSGMSTHGGDTGANDDNDQSAYLNISNCSTSKQGIVNVPENSHLNFRIGPSVDYSKILIDMMDDDSYVRQLRGSSVTVIDTVNTTEDEENPVWLKIQIKYNELTLVGYSSQTWIDLPGIRHISQGSVFTVTADTNEEYLTWSCNDTSVARINASTGEITAIKPGVVLVTVTSDSGLTDSCLIAID